MTRWIRIQAMLLVATLCLAVGCSGAEGDNQAFAIDVVPQTLNGFSIAGQHCVFLVTIDDEGETGKVPVTITASADGAEVTILNKDILEGQVAEVVVIPAAASVGKSVTVSIQGARGTASDQASVTFEVIEGEDDRKDYAGTLLAKFIPWLVENHPEFGIKADTEWTGTMVSPQWLVVSHYLFFSEEWELHIQWHIMVAPSDWARIDLRHRFDESAPSFAFEISSLEANDTPIPIEVPDTAWR